jgi:glucans biosynthesis protein
MRLHLTFALITALALVITLHAGAGHPFAFAQVEEMAKKRAAEKYVALPDVLPPPLKKLTPQQDAGIFWKDTYRLWRKKGLPFQVDFYPQLNSNPQPHVAPQINTVDRKGPHRLAYSPTFFNFLNVTTNPPTPLVFSPPLPSDLGYAGFYVRYPAMGIGSNTNSLDGFFSALGGSYFRVLAKEQVYGLSARGLAIDTGIDGKVEEFPEFTDWWLREPGPNATVLVLDALLDSPSVSGAYEFTIRPGGVTSVDIHASLFFRQKVDRLGVAPFSSMYLFGENAKNHFGDNVHPEIHDSDGVLLHTGADEWMWRPLAQSNDPNAGPIKGYQLQLYDFLDMNPKGFGLIQRDRDFQHYQDLQMKYNVRPSAWVTPHGDWGKGAVQLIQRPSNDFNTDNVVLLWHPQEAVKAGDHLDLNYTIDFYMNDATRPPLAYCRQTLVNCPAPPPPAPPPPNAPVAVTSKTTGSTAPAAQVKASTPAPPVPAVPAPPTGTVPVQFLVDFMGNGIEGIPANQPPDLDLGYAPPGTYLREKNVEKNGYDNSWRVTFTIIPVKHFLPTELHCRLLRDGKPITETWSYTWHQ